MATLTSSDVILERMMALHPKVIDLTLDRMWRLLEALGHPETKLPPVIHIAGTNGKGSTLAMLRAGLMAGGQKVHAYTSPHLARFHERIRLADVLISEEALSEILDECYEANGPDPITYFEITTCAALLAFSRVPADTLLLEVGLGGRLDATNVVDRPVMTVITPVSMDHEAFLGNTIDKIAFEKAGILKRGVPCVVGPQHEDGLAVIEAQAAKVGAPLLAHGQQWHAFEERGRLIYQDESGLLDLPLPNLLGAHQIENAGAALAVLRHLEQSDATFEGAVTNAEWPARMQKLKAGPLVDSAPGTELWLDGGHNPAAGHAIAAHFKTLPTRPTYVICGMLNTKDASGYLAPFAGVVDGLIAVAVPGEANTLQPDYLAAFATEAGLDAQTSPSVEDALAAITTLAPFARVLISGSLYLAGHILRSNG